MARVLVFGSLNIDMVFSVPHIVRPGETISSVSLTRSAGGKGANQAAALAKAGVEVSLAGKIGEDGRFLLALLGSYGVDTSGVVVGEGATGQAIIQVDEAGQNSIVLYSGGNGEITSEEVDAGLAGFRPGDTVVLQNEIVRVGEIIEKAASLGLSVCLNPSPYNARIETLPLEMVNTFFVNEIEGASLAGRDFFTNASQTLDDLCARFPKSEFLLTCGAAGAYYASGKKRAHAPASSDKVVDTTGAGDTFSGYFLASRGRGFSVEQSLALSCKAAGIAVSRRGAMEAVPVGSEVFAEPAPSR